MTFHEFLAGSSRDPEKLTSYNAQAVFLGSWVVYLGGPYIDVVSSLYHWVVSHPPKKNQWNIPTQSPSLAPCRRIGGLSAWKIDGCFLGGFLFGYLYIHVFIYWMIYQPAVAALPKAQEIHQG